MMEDPEAENIKGKRLEAKKAEEQLKTALRMALDDAAYLRLMNVAMANKELYLTAAKNILMANQRAKRKLTDAEVLSFLRAIKEQTEAKTTITFNRK
jgi:DNA-binding TFAR19-related protein (PDSD5 family)